MFSRLKVLAVVGVTFLLPLMVTVGSSVSVISMSAVAAEPKYKGVKSHSKSRLDRTCAKALDKVQGYNGPIFAAGELGEKEDGSALWLEAKSMLNDIERRPKVCDSPYEQSQVWNMLGYVHYSMDDFTGATGYYRKVVEGVGTPPEMKLDTRYTLAQFYSMQEKYALAVEQLEIWIDAVIIVGLDARMLIAQLYYQLELKADALKMVEIAIDESEAKDILPKETMWSLQRVLYYDKDDLKKVTSILQKLVKHYPKLTYWKQLVGITPDILPVYVPPWTPRRAQTRGKEGYAMVSVTITAIGSVRDPIMIKEFPEGWGFGRAAVKAALKLKYNPRVVDGVGQEVPNVLYIFSSETVTTKQRKVNSESAQYIPLYVPQPQYPPQAQTRGKEGYAVVEVTITSTGGVRAPILIEEFPEGWGFGKAAVKAALKLKYNPRVVDGVEQEVPNVLYKFKFQMAK